MMNIKLIKLVRNTKMTNKDGKEFRPCKRYIQLDDKRILINPVYKDGYILFDAFASVEFENKHDGE